MKNTLKTLAVLLLLASSSAFALKPKFSEATSQQMSARATQRQKSYARFAPKKQQRANRELMNSQLQMAMMRLNEASSMLQQESLERQIDGATVGQEVAVE